MPNWYFDTKIKRCRQFYYGGCGGNENRFLTEGDCENRCSKTQEEPTAPATQTQAPQQQLPARTEEPQTRPTEQRPQIERQRDHCLLPYKSGNCEEKQRRYYYDSSYGICTQFLYSGCDGNENNFETLAECESLCDDAVNLCNLDVLEGGGCEENITRWYYDSHSGRCHSFQYSGCYGNKNNFDDESSCLNACRDRDQTAEIIAPTTSAPRAAVFYILFHI